MSVVYFSLSEGSVRRPHRAGDSGSAPGMVSPGTASSQSQAELVVAPGREEGRACAAKSSCSPIPFSYASAGVVLRAEPGRAQDQAVPAIRSELCTGSSLQCPKHRCAPNRLPQSCPPFLSFHFYPFILFEAVIRKKLLAIKLIANNREIVKSSFSVPERPIEWPPKPLLCCCQ